MTAADTDTSRAVAATARVLANPPSPDPEVTAAHIVAALKGMGWRPTAARPAPPWQAPAGPRLPEGRMRELAARARQSLKEARRDA